MDRTLGPRLKVERAKQHIADVADELEGFINAPPPPYTVVTQDDPETGALVYRAAVHPQAQEWLDQIALVFGDAIHNLRAALDFIAWQLVESNNGGPSRWTTFPIADSWKEFDSGGPRFVNGAGEDAIKLLREIRPYKGGNNDLWRLHRLDIADKHRLLLAMGSVYTAALMGYRASDGTEFAVRLVPRQRIFPVVDQTELHRVEAQYRDHVKKHPDPQFGFEVAISDGDSVKGEGVLKTLADSVSAVERVIEVFRPLLFWNDRAARH